MVAPPPVLLLAIPEDFKEPPATFTSFKLNAENKMAVAACKGWVNTYMAKHLYPPPLLCGPVGTGKSRLLYTIFNEIKIRMDEWNKASYLAEVAKIRKDEDDVEIRPAYRKFKGRVISMARYAEELRDRVAVHKDMLEYRNNLLDCDVMAIDDIGAESQSDFVRQELYLLVDARVLARKPLMVTCNFAPEEMGQWLGERIRSRMEGASDFVRMGGPDMRVFEKQRRIERS